MKNLGAILAAGLLLAASSCTEKGNGPGVISVRTCGICHGLPPKDAGHSFHVNALYYKCSYCHAGYAADSGAGMFAVNALTHMNGDTDVVFSAPWNGSGRAAFDFASKQCRNVYCHGAIPQGTRSTVVWVGGQPTNGRCYACHDSAAFAAYHYGHGRIQNFNAPNIHGATVNNCYKCHGDSLADTAYSVPKLRVDPVKHINGVFDGGTCRTCHLTWATWEQYVAANPGATPYGK